MDQQWTWRENQALAGRLHAAKLKGTSVEDIDYIDYCTSRGLDKSLIRPGAEVGLGHQSREHLCARAYRRRQELRCLRIGTEGMSRCYSALYMRAVALFRDLSIARADGSLRSLLVRLSRIDVLVIGD